MFKAEYGERLLNMQLGNEEYVEHVFKPFNTKVRTAVISSVKPLMRARKFQARTIVVACACAKLAIF